MKKIIIVGGGIGGCGTALELAKAGHEVVLIEMRKELLQGSSNNTPCRLGLGFHYIDPDTAIKYLRATIKIAREHQLFEENSHFIVGGEKPLQHPYRRGRYFIVKHSSFSLQQILALYADLQKEYRKLIEEDPRNEIFGPAEEFYRILTLEEYQDHVNCKKVVLGIETAEHILDWPRFQKALIEKIHACKNITVLTNTEVSGIRHASDSMQYELTVATPNIDESLNEEKYALPEQTIKADLIINSSWENVEKINHEAGFFRPEKKVTKRLKVIVEIQLPDGIESDHPLNSMFFCFGPHCSFNNTGNGKGFLSFEPVTNIGMASGLDIPEAWKTLLHQTPTKESIQTYGEKILEGAAQYMPILEGATLLSAKFGIVKTLGSVDIYSANSDFHKRNYSGVEQEETGWINNACMKLMYFLDNAKEVSHLVGEHEKAMEQIEKITSSIRNTSSNVDLVSLKNAIRQNLQRRMEMTQPDQDVEAILQSIHAKMDVIRELKMR